ncbi:MAG: hypothetical protein ABW101_04905 [Candidatus Thiodiazotropha sp.]
MPHIILTFTYLSILSGLLTSCGDGNGNASTLTPKIYTDRISLQRYDYDHNGIYEGLSEYFYDGTGRLVENRYTYTDDDSPDSDYLSTYHDYIHTYHYNSDGLLDLITRTDSSGGGKNYTRYTYNDDGTIAQSDYVVESDDLGVTFSNQYRLEYADRRLTRYVSSLTDTLGGGTETVLIYDPAGRVESMRIIPSDGRYEGSASFTYQSNNRPATASFAPPTPPRLGYMYHSFTYNEADQLAMYEESIVPDGDGGYYNWTYTYDDDSRLIESVLDHDLDGQIETVVQTEWEHDACVAVIFWDAWQVTSMKAVADSPYLPNTGYAYLPVCGTGEF